MRKGRRERIFEGMLENASVCMCHVYMFIFIILVKWYMGVERYMSRY